MSVRDDTLSVRTRGNTWLAVSVPYKFCRDGVVTESNGIVETYPNGWRKFAWALSLSEVNKKRGCWLPPESVMVCSAMGKLQ
jgi:hypothetical protein